MVKTWLAVALMWWSAIGLAASPMSPKAAKLVGHYYAKNMREVGSELKLQPDGSFEWTMSYGAMDRYAQGHWVLERDEVVLTPDAPKGTPKLRLFEEGELRIRRPAEDGHWLAIVGMPGVGPATGIQVQFQSASGKLTSAVTDRNGDAMVAMPATERWTRAGLRRQGDNGAWQWFDIPPARADARLTAFAVDDLSQVAPPPFDQLKLRRVAGKLVTEDGRLEYER